MLQEEISTKLAKYLLEVKAVQLNPTNPFTWASGLRSPIYCDNRLTLSFPHVRDFIRDRLVNVIVSQFEDVDYIAGVATAGIPQGVLIANELEKPFIYVRPEPKKHGMKNTVEGYLREGAKVLLIEDLVSTGKSSMAAAQNLINVGAEVVGLISVFTYGLPIAYRIFEEARIPFYSLSNYQDLIQYALSANILSKQELTELEAWSKDPQAWSDLYLAKTT